MSGKKTFFIVNFILKRSSGLCLLTYTAECTQWHPVMVDVI